MDSKINNTTKHERILAEQRDYNAKRSAGYREKALKLYPWVCGRCAREFSRTNLRELEVHHIDHNHDNNAPDGSNWELLCMYCHDHEHSKYVNFVEGDSGSNSDIKAATFNPFADLKEKMKNKK
ncbi:MAG: 5-methylcytosine-specific restriction endonuclease McrA [Oleiphilaceae bacterium]|jgi:5-methylcytosine-specific restriction endonuclease McrA